MTPTIRLCPSVMFVLPKRRQSPHVWVCVKTRNIPSRAHEEPIPPANNPRAHKPFTLRDRLKPVE